MILRIVRFVRRERSAIVNGDTFADRRNVVAETCQKIDCRYYDD